MNISAALPSPSAGDWRHAALLDAAVGVFARYGYRKSSMDEVARAAGVSRQGLYLQFSNKEELFRRALAHSLDNQLKAAVAALGRSEESLESRLIAACDEWSGRFVGTAHASDLMCAGTALAGATLSRYEGEFERAIAGAIADSPLSDECRHAGHCAMDFARALHATARGLKHSAGSRQEFVKGMSVAARMFCAPLNKRSR